MKKLFTIAGVLLGGFVLSAQTVLFQDFEDTKLFKTDGSQIKQVGLSKNPGGNWLGFREDFSIVNANAPTSQGKQALQISRITPGYNIQAFRTFSPAKDSEYTYTFSFKPAAEGGWGMRLHNWKQNKIVADIRFMKDNTILSMNGVRGHFVARTVPNEWQTAVIRIIPGSECIDFSIIKADGTVLKGNSAPLFGEVVPIDMISFFHMPGLTSKVLIDDIKIEATDFASTAGRENVALSVSDAKAYVISGGKKVPAAKLQDGDLGSLSNQLVKLPAQILLELPHGTTVTSARLHSGIADYKNYASGDVSATSYIVEGFSTAAGQWRELVKVSKAPVAANVSEDDTKRFSQADFDSIEVTQLRVTITDSNDTRMRNSGRIAEKYVILREIELYTTERGRGSAGLSAVMQAEYRLPVYRDQDTAHIHAILDSSVPEVEIALIFKDRNNGSVPVEPFKVKLKAGENIIPVNIKGWKDGEYRTLLRSVSDSVKGEFARLLRLNRSTDTAVTENDDWSGKRMYFPDKIYFQSSSGVKTEVVNPDNYPLNKPFISGKEWYIQLGSSVMFDSDGRLVMKFNEFTRDWKQKKERFARIKPGEWKWELIEKPQDFAGQNSEIAGHVAPNIGRAGYTFTDGAKGNFRLYDAAKDGAVNLKQLQIFYVGYKPADWGVVTAPPQTSWLIWKKGDEYILLKDKPFLADGISSDEFESPDSTNDNFAGQWLSEDGKTLFYARGRTLKRYAPFIARYDNLWMASRILTVFSTKDGFNWERCYFAIPDEKDAPAAQHYGATIYRVPRGNGMMLAIQMNYSALHQQYDLEIVYSTDNGKNWKRMADRKPWIAAAPPNGWNFGLTNMHNNILEKDGKFYHVIGWAAPLPHYSYEVIGRNDAADTITAEEMRKKFDWRGMRNWPYWKHFGSYEKLAEAHRSLGSTCGISVYRKNGWFGLKAADKGIFITIPVKASGSLAANYQTEKDGYIKFSLLDENDKVIAERTVSGDNVSGLVFDKLPSGSFRIKADMYKAMLYTIDFDK